MFVQFLLFRDNGQQIFLFKLTKDAETLRLKTPWLRKPHI